MRILLLGCGHICSVLGLVGVAVPGFPSVPFYLAAIWFYMRSSQTMVRKVLRIPAVGNVVKDWLRYRTISKKAKLAAFIAIITSLSIIIMRDYSFVMKVAITTCLLCVLIFICTRKSEVPLYLKQKGILKQ
jgi:uncharacterized membrane protein YbaN (DUF454 family)